jgi:general secretion pathway protein D
MMKQFIFALLLFSPLVAIAQALDASKTSPGKIVWNLKDVDIHTVIEQVAKATGRNFLIDPKVTGKVSIISTQPMDSAALYQVFLSMLQLNGFSAVPSGDVIKIVPSIDAKQMAVPLVDKAKPGRGDEMVVRVIHANNVQADKLMYVVQPMLPASGTVSVYSPGNSLIISGMASTVERIAEIIQRIDTSNADELEVIPLQHILADDVVGILGNLNKDDAAKGQVKTFSLVADKHSNSVLLKGSEVLRQKLKEVLQRIDVPSKSTLNNSRVVYLRFLKAKDLAPVLSKIVESNVAQTATTPKAVIQAEPNTNALIINAPPLLMQNLNMVINKLDIRPAQVLVEAAIAEVSDSLIHELGIAWQSVNAPNADSPVPGNALGVSIGFIRTGSLRAIVNALASDQNVNILSTPSIVVMDNQQAKIEIGKTVSVRSSQYPGNASGSGTTNPYTTYSREKVGLHLYVTPQITQGDTVQLLIDQANDSIEESSNTSSALEHDPIFNNRDINTSVMVDVKAMLVLGGLITTESQDGTRKIPILGDIPGLGNLFQVKSRRMEKKNLMVFLQPVILRDSKSNQAVTVKKYEYMRQQQLEQTKRPASWLPPADSAVLQSLQAAPALPQPFAE